jgi:hypothetical protein
MLVKSMAVPLVLATAVLEVIRLVPMTGVPLIVGLVMVALVIVALVIVGLVFKTLLPLPVDVVTPVPPLAIGNVPLTPLVKGNPVTLVITPDAGVPSAAVVKVGLLNVPPLTVGLLIVGLVAKTTLPVPVAVVLPVPPLETGTGAFNTVGATCPELSK